MIQTRGSVSKLSALKVHEREKDTKQWLEKQRKRRAGMLFISSNTEESRKGVREGF